MAVAAFLAGLGAYETIIRIAHLEVVPRADLERLRSIASATPAGPTTPKVADSSRERPRPSLPQLKFAAKPPFLEGFEAAVPGIRLSDAQRMFPGGQTSRSTYQVPYLNSPLFRTLVFGMHDDTADPVVATVWFSVQDDDAAKAVLLAATTQFGAIPHDSLALGSALVWPNIGGFTLEVDDRGYRIYLADTQKAPK